MKNYILIFTVFFMVGCAKKQEETPTEVIELEAKQDSEKSLMDVCLCDANMFKDFSLKLDNKTKTLHLEGKLMLDNTNVKQRESDLKNELIVIDDNGIKKVFFFVETEGGSSVRTGQSSLDIKASLKLTNENIRLSDSIHLYFYNDSVGDESDLRSFHRTCNCQNKDNEKMVRPSQIGGGTVVTITEFP